VQQSLSVRGCDERKPVVADELETLEDEPAPGREETPFDSIEGAGEYVRLLGEAIVEAEAAIQEDITEARGQGAARRVQALQVVALKLEKLGGHVMSSRRILNDLRTLRRLLLGERGRQ
jgi:hypothetical protein